MTPEALLCSEYPRGLQLLHVRFCVGHTVMPEQACCRSPSIKWTASSKLCNGGDGLRGALSEQRVLNNSMLCLIFTLLAYRSAAPGDKRQSAVEALKELQQTLKGSSAGSGEMNRSPSMTKRKRAGPARTSSAKTLKAEPMA